MVVRILENTPALHMRIWEIRIDITVIRLRTKRGYMDRQAYTRILNSRTGVVCSASAYSDLLRVILDDVTKNSADTIFTQSNLSLEFIEDAIISAADTRVESAFTAFVPGDEIANEVRCQIRRSVIGWINDVVTELVNLNQGISYF